MPLGSQVEVFVPLVKLNSILVCKNHFTLLLFFCVSEFKPFSVKVAFFFFLPILDEDEEKSGGSRFDVILIAPQVFVKY